MNNQSGKVMYCITHEEEVNVINNQHIQEINEHERIICMDITWTKEWCNGPFTTCPPPELPDSWQDFVTEPAPDELIEMDKCADELLKELEQA